MGCGVLMGGWIGSGWVSGSSRWVCGMRLGCVFFLLYIVGFFNVILIFVYIILMCRIEE